MPTVAAEESQSAWAPVAAKPLDEAVWRAWVAKGRAQDRLGCAKRIKAVKWVTIAGLLGAAALWSHLAPFEAGVRLLVAAGAMVAMFQTIQAKNYAFAIVFGALALLYNPIAPAFLFSGDWQRAVVAASAVPFVASLAWPKVMKTRTAQE